MINTGLFALGTAFAPTEAVAEVNPLTSTLDKIRTESLSYLSGEHGQTELFTTKGNRTNSIIIGGVKYYYTPNEGSAEANQKLVNLANTASAAMVSSTTEPDNYVFKIDNGDSTYTYYSYDTSNDAEKFAKSGIKISTTSTGAAGEQTVTQSQADGSTIAYYINHVTPEGYTTGAQNTNLTTNISNETYANLQINANNAGGALTVKSGNTVDYITGDFSNNSNINAGGQSSTGGAIYTNGTIGQITGDFYENTNKFRAGAVQVNGNITSITGDFYGNSASENAKSAGGAINIVKGKTVDSIVGNFINNIVSSGNDGGAINSDGTINNIYGSFVHNSSARHGGAINTFSDGSSIGNITADFTDNVAAEKGGAIRNMVNIANINSQFVNNSAQYGGAIYNEEKAIKITDSNFVNNSASQDGGAILREVSDDEAQRVKTVFWFDDAGDKRYWTIEALGSYQYDLTKITGTEEFKIDSSSYVYTPADSDIANLTNDKNGTKYSYVQTAILDTINSHLEDNTMQNLYLMGDVKLRVDVDLGNSYNINKVGLDLGRGSDTFKTSDRNNIFGPNDDKVMVVDSINLLSGSRKDAVAVQITNEYNHHVAVSPNILENITGADNLHGKVEYRDETGELVIHDRFAVISDLADALNTLVEGTVATYHGLYEKDANGDYVYLKNTDEEAKLRYVDDDGNLTPEAVAMGVTIEDGYILDPQHHEKIKKFDPLVGTITYSS
ncbi:MAG: hypothetical protein II830_00295, partial [Alphaproteobacteria bacterium]|nr:hypothetical protein [Alphaproteobacteria bacterium]